MSRGGALTQNFGRGELECKCGCGGCKMSPHFLQRLQHLRDLYGKPITVTSGYRCQKHNRDVGGSVSSMHLIGKAVDIQCTSDTNRHRLIRLATSIFNGIGVGADFIHLDDRDRSTKLWVY